MPPPPTPQPKKKNEIQIVGFRLNERQAMPLGGVYRQKIPGIH